MTKRRHAGKLAIFFLAAGIYAAFPWLSGYAFLQYMKIKHDIAIHGRWHPSYFPLGQFYIRDLKAAWKRDFQILSGELDVRYDPFLFSISRGGVALTGRDLQVSAQKENLNLKVKGPFAVNRFHAEFELRPDKDPVIHALEIDSPVIQFKVNGRSA